MKLGDEAAMALLSALRIYKCLDEKCYSDAFDCASISPCVFIRKKDGIPFFEILLYVSL